MLASLTFATIGVYTIKGFPALLAIAAALLVLAWWERSTLWPRCARWSTGWGAGPASRTGVKGGRSRRDHCAGRGGPGGSDAAARPARGCRDPRHRRGDRRAGTQGPG